VKSLLDSGKLEKSSPEDEERFGKDKNRFFANFVVVQPYVLFQPY